MMVDGDVGRCSSITDFPMKFGPITKMAFCHAYANVSAMNEEKNKICEKICYLNGVIVKTACS